MSDEWYTPRPILELALRLMDRHWITYDPCPRPGCRDNWPCADLFSDGSFYQWTARDEVRGAYPALDTLDDSTPLTGFINPPYSHPLETIVEALSRYHEAPDPDSGRLAFLVKGDFTTNWARMLFSHCDHLVLLRDRIKFERGDGGGVRHQTANFPSVVFLKGPISLTGTAPAVLRAFEI
jgi:hypothetical protein